MTDLSDFHEQLHNNFTKGTFVGFVVSGKKSSQSFTGASGYLAGFGPFTMTNSSENYEVFYNKNSRSFIDKDKCINIPLNWTSDGKHFIDPHGQSENVFTLKNYT